LPSRFRTRLKEQADGLHTLPESGAILFESYRRVLLKRFPYMAVYPLVTVASTYLPWSAFDVTPPGSMRRSPAALMSSQQSANGPKKVTPGAKPSNGGNWLSPRQRRMF